MIADRQHHEEHKPPADEIYAERYRYAHVAVAFSYILKILLFPS
jgi:hypothetical protein